MGPREILRFFRAVERGLSGPVVVVLTGAAAGSLFGNVRASLDIDFAVSPKRGSKERWGGIEAAVGRAMQETGITAQYSEDIERWGMITLGHYRKRTVPYRVLGKVELRLLHPLDWAVGKLSRYMEQDILDLRAVLAKKRVGWEEAAHSWGGALRASPPSSDQGHFRKHVEHFLRAHGRQVWGARFDAAAAARAFHQRAGIRAG